MNIATYEKVGKVIYGVQRLDGTLQSVERWLSGQEGAPAVIDEGPPEQKFDRRMAAANAFFSAKQISPRVAAQYARTAGSVRDLELASQSMMGLDPERIDALLAHTRDAHLAVADMMDDIGYTALSSDRLRARADDL